MAVNETYPAVPEHLSEKSKRLYAEYIGTEIKTAARVALIVRGLESLDMADQCVRAIRQDGISQRSERSGIARQHPSLNTLKAATDTMLKVWTSLGLNLEKLTPPWG